MSAHEAAGYEFQSQGIIDMLEIFLDKFVSERTMFEKVEMNPVHAFKTLVQNLKAQIAQAQPD